MGEITVLGKVYEVVESDEITMGGNMGACCRLSQTIVLSKDQGKDQMRDTIIHEIIHLINEELKLELDETTIARLGCGLASVDVLNVKISIGERKVLNPHKKSKNEKSIVDAIRNTK